MAIHPSVRMAVVTTLVTLTWGCTPPPPTQSQAPQSSVPETTDHHSATPSPSDHTMTDIDYVINLGLMKGHLMVAKELLDQGVPGQAEPHIGHPVEEIYHGMEAVFQQRNVPEFKTTLMKLHDQVKADSPDMNQVNNLWDQAMQAIDTALLSVPGTQFQEPKFVLPVINGLLETAQAEYEAAIIDDQVVEVVEYQDSRGFVIYAEQLYQKITPAIKSQNPDIDQQIQKNITQLKQAWPSVMPPAKVILPPSQVSELTQQIAQAGNILALN